MSSPEFFKPELEATQAVTDPAPDSFEKHLERATQGRNAWVALSGPEFGVYLRVCPGMMPKGAQMRADLPDGTVVEFGPRAQF